MINKGIAISLAAAVGLAALPIEVTAKGFGGHMFHHRAGQLHNDRHGGHNGFYGYYGNLYGGYLLGYEPTSEIALPEQIRAVPTPAATLSCHHSRETVTVLSEEGGTREITIIRC
jgi:hypothetical protein